MKPYLHPKVGNIAAHTQKRSQKPMFLHSLGFRLNPVFQVSSSEEDEDPPQEAQEEKPDSEPPAGKVM